VPANPTTSGSPRVTVVIAVHDAGRWLDDTLRSVAEQTFPAWRCHVIDDGSTDDTAAVADRFADADPRFRVVRQPNSGVSRARNRVLAETAGEAPYVAVLDGDDLWLPDALDVLTRALDEDAGAVGVQSLAEYIDEEGTPLRPGAHPAVQRRKFRVDGRRVVPVEYGIGAGFTDLLVTSGLYPPASMLFRRSAVEAAGRYDPAFRAQGDWDMYLRMSRLGHFVELDRQTAWYRIRAKNLTGDRTKVVEFQARLMRNAWSSTEPGSVDRRACEVAYRYRQRRAFRMYAVRAKHSFSHREIESLGVNGALATWYALHLPAPRPPQPRRPVLRVIGRLQSNRWAAY